MRCRAHQLCVIETIAIWDNESERALREQIDGLVVTTVVPVSPAHWRVAPEPRFTCPRMTLDAAGNVSVPGEVVCIKVPDAWLRPLGDEVPADGVHDEASMWRPKRQLEKSR